jgi:hypothetical protein
MVGKMKRWLKAWFGVDVLERENITLVLALKRFQAENDTANKNLIAELAQLDCRTNGKFNGLATELEANAIRQNKELGALLNSTDDHEARIAFLENQLTSKADAAKIVPKANKMTFRKFAQAAEAASEEETPE